jgi:glucose dehydrogenase
LDAILKIRKLVYITILVTLITAIYLIGARFNLKQIYYNYKAENDKELITQKLVFKYLSVRAEVDKLNVTSDKFVGQHYESKITQNHQNLRLKPSWDFSFEIPQNVESTPIICSSNLILAIPSGMIYGLDPFSGALKWKSNLNQYAPLGRRGISCTNSSGPSGHILIPGAKGVLCVDARTGKIDEKVCNSGFLGSSFSLIPPEFSNNTVYVATVNPSGVESYNFINGSLNWRKIFNNKNGANPWSGMTVDNENNQILLSLGSPSNWMEISNDDEKYKYSNSIVSLNLTSGMVKWQYQEVDKDFWDHDTVGKPLIYRNQNLKKDLIIGFNKSGSVFFLDPINGIPILDHRRKLFKFGDVEYNKIITEGFPNTLPHLSNNPIKLKLPNGNSAVFGYVPPLLKKTRIIEGYSGGPQWPGGIINHDGSSLVLTSNRNLLLSSFIDMYPVNGFYISDSKEIKQCTQCHDPSGLVKKDKNRYTPSLFLTSKLYKNTNELKKYLLHDHIHGDSNLDLSKLNDIFKLLNQYDDEVLENRKISIFTDYSFDYNNGVSRTYGSPPFGLITSISLIDFSVTWQVPSGYYFDEFRNKLVEGSPSYAGLAEIGNKNIYVFAGSFDKNIYLIDGKDGSYLGSIKLAASASAKPLVVKDGNNYWIYIVAGGSRVPGNQSSILYAVKYEGYQ